MKAYAIFIRERTRDPVELESYNKTAPSARQGREMRLLARYGRQKVLEGPEAEGTVIIEFPNMAAAEAWYLSPAYQAARAHRLKGSDYRVIIVEGLDP